MGIDIDGKKERAYFIVQVAGNVSALLFLHCGQLRIQSAVLHLRGLQLIGHAIELFVDRRQLLRAVF